jgi:uncharacterized protein YjdB
MRNLTILLLMVVNGLFAQQWQPIPMVSQAIKNAGHSGGEGCQWPQAIEVDATDGSFLLFGTDVGGIFRSTNGGAMWEPCNIGFDPRGNCGFAIDPNNSNRALAIGGNSIENSTHGIYLTTDKAATWQHVYAEGGYRGYRDFKEKVAYDKSSYNSTLGYSTIAYWSNPVSGLYKSTNGGQTWSLVNASYGASIVKVNSGNGYVYIGNTIGLYRSTNGGTSFTQIISGEIRDIAVVNSNPTKVWAAKSNALFISNDNGGSFAQVSSGSFPTNAVTIEVSPTNISKMVACNNTAEYDKPIYYSSNGGSTWTMASLNNTNSFIPFNGRTHKFAWHPTNESKVWGFGGDWITSSTNSGATFSWDANGYTGIMAGEIFNFNISNPNIVFIASQDYNGALSLDNGQTWKYCNFSGEVWGGAGYGAYAASANVLVTKTDRTTKNLTISTNGGTSFTKTSHQCTGLETACGDAKDANVIYMSNWRSTNLGSSWSAMSGCSGVFIANLFGNKEVYGGYGANVVKSTDKGASWQTVVTLPANVKDVALDHVLNRLYITTDGRRLFKYEGSTLTEITDNLPQDQFNNRQAKSVAVDPVNTQVVYVAGTRDVYCSDASVCRSQDGGQTWEILTRNDRTNNVQFGKDGGREAVVLRVHPTTRELWVGTGTYGIWKIGPPSSGSIPVTSVSVSPTTATINVGATQQLTATVLPTDATNKTVSWGSGNTSVATVNSSGLVTGVSAGTAIVTVTTQDGNKTATSTITVSSTTTGDGLKGEYFNNITLTAPVTVTRTEATVNFNWGTGSPASGIGSDNFSVRWTGFVKPQYNGTYTFYANTNDGNRLWVNGVQITNRWSDGVAENSDTISLTADVLYPVTLEMYEGTNTATAILSWSHASQAKQVIPQSRLFTTSTTVPVTSVSVSPTTATINVSGTQQLTATVLPANATNKTVSWSSGNSSVATVNSSGLVTAVAAGTAIITVTTQDGGKTAQSTITVVVPVTSVSVSPTTATINVGATQQLTATVLPANATNKTVSWSSGNTSVATVNSSGLVTAVAAGTAIITVTTQDGGKTANSAITVNGASTLVMAVNCGGAAAGSYQADNSYSGGGAFTSTNTIDLSGVSNPAPSAVYQTERYGNHTYTLTGFTANAPYIVRLHFAETWHNAANLRKFNVTIQGTTVLSNYDIWAEVGKNKAVVKEFNTTANSSGNIVIVFTTVTDNAKSGGIEILTTGSLPAADMFIPKANSATPVIDGNVDAIWATVAAKSISNINSGTISSTSDCSGTFKALWDATNLYVLFEVTNDNKSYDSGSSYWEDDGVELYIDVNNDKATSYGANDFQYVFVWGSSTAAIETKHSATTGVVRATANPTSTTYRIEVKIPWSTLSVSGMTGNVYMGLEAMISDDDSGGAKEGKRAWFGTTDNAWQNPSLFGTAWIDATTLKSANIQSAILKDQQNEPSINIYPNPVGQGNSLKIELGIENQQVNIIEIVGLSGKRLYSGRFSGNLLEIPVQLQPGMYLIKATHGSTTSTKKLIVN